MAKTVVWNGVLGKVEDPRFAKASLAVAYAIGENKDCFSVIGGGDTAGFIDSLDDDDLSYGLVSTGGGASLELLSGKSLPGLEILLNS